MTQTGRPDPPALHPLLATGDESLLDDLLRLCAAAGVTPDVARDATATRRGWATAGMVLVGGDLSRQLVAAAPARRGNVVLVSRDSDDASVWQKAVTVGAEHVCVLPDAEQWLVDALGACLDGSPTPCVTVSIVGGCGGAGASTLAGALAVTAVDRDRRVLLVDADPLGGGIDMVLGNEDSAGLRWPDLSDTQGRVSAASLREALPSFHSLSVLSWDRGDSLTIPPESMRSVLDAGQRGHDLVVVDVPRRLDAAAEEALTRSTMTVLVVPGEVRAVAAAARTLGRLRLIAQELAVVVRGPGPSGLDGEVVAESLGLPLLACMRPERGLAEALDQGLGPVRRRRGPLVSGCLEILDRLLGSSSAVA
ncbi:MAG: septum site-determining protein Ssd [Nocardioidaceae bacterium]